MQPKRGGSGEAVVGIVVALWLSAQGSFGARAQQPSETDRVGKVAEITRDVESSWTSGGQSTGSSYDKDTLIERVVGSNVDGLELEYDLPAEVTADDRFRNWQFPVRVFRPTEGPLRLLNGHELEARVDAWLKVAGLPRTTCGHSYVTWNVFRIDCDPQSVVPVIEQYNLRFGDLRDGATLQDSRASGPTTLRRTALESHGYDFYGSLVVDPEQVRRDEANSDVIAAEVNKEALTFGEAIRARAAEKISGTIEVSIETDASGLVRRRTKRTELEIVSPNNATENRTTVEVVERGRLPGGSFQPDR